MAEKKTLEVAKQELETTLAKTIQLIDYLGVASTSLYGSLNSMQDIFDEIRGIPDDNRMQYQMLQKMREAWKKQADDIANDTKSGTNNTTPGMSNIEIGFSTVAVSPSLAAGLATCFETVSLGLLAPSLGNIPTLAAAIAIGAAPIVEPVSALVACIIILSVQSEIDCARDIFTRIYERNNKAYERAIAEISERISRIHSENNRLIHGIKIVKGFGNNYKEMTIDQKYELGTYMNLMLSSTQLVVNPISGLKPFYSNMDLDNYILCLNEKIEKCDSAYLTSTDDKRNHAQAVSSKDNCLLEKVTTQKLKNYVIENRTLLLYLCNLLYDIKLEERDKRVLCKCMAKNKDIVEKYQLTPNDINTYLINTSIGMISNKLKQTY